MAVPKKRTSSSKRGLRRAGQHHKLRKKSVFKESTTGEFTLPHRMSPSGYYKGIRFVEPKEKKSDEEETQE